MDINKYSPKSKVSFKNLLQLANCDVEDLCEIFHLARLLKSQQSAGEFPRHLRNKTIAFISASLPIKNRLSFEMAVNQLGGQSIFTETSDLLLSDNGTKHNAKLINGYNIDAIVFSGQTQAQIELFAKHSNLAVLNNFSDAYSPFQALTDIFTVWETFHTLQGVKLCYVGSATSYAESLLVGAVMCGIDVHFACPKGSSVSSRVIDKAMQYADFTISDSPAAAIKNADIVAADSFSGETDDLQDFVISEKLFALAKEDAYFIHPLNSPKSLQVDKIIVDGKRSLIYNQAENGLCIQKAILSLIK